MPKKKKSGADDPSRAFGGGADNVAFSDIRHIRPDTEDMLEYVLGLRPPTEAAPAAEEDALEEDNWDGPPDGADPVAAIAMRIQMLEGLCERLEGEREKKMDEVTAMLKIVNQKEKAVQKLQKEEEELNKELDEADKLTEERTARHNNNIDEKKRLTAEIAELTTKRDKMRIKCGVGTGAAGGSGGPSFDKVFKTGDPQAQREEREAKHEVVTFEQINKPRMPGWLSTLDGAANESAAAALSATMDGGATGGAAAVAAAEGGEMSGADFAARMEVDSDDEEAVASAAASLSLTGTLTGPLTPTGSTKLPPISPAARSPAKAPLAV